MRLNNKSEVEFQCVFVDYDNGGATGFYTKIESLHPYLYTCLIQNGERSFGPRYISDAKSCWTIGSWFRISRQIIEFCAVFEGVVDLTFQRHLINGQN